MKKFGFGKKKGEAGDSGGRDALFSTKNNQPPSNPYAQGTPANDPYAAGNIGGGGSRSEKTPVPIGGYGGGGDRYGAGSYGNSGGYGQQQDRFGANNIQPPSGGYGQQPDRFGANNNHAPSGGSRYGGDPGARDQLFAGARAPAEDGPPAYGQNGYGNQPSQNDWESGRGANYGQQQGGTYGAYGDNRELTAEEQEEENVTGMKQEVKFIKQQDVASTRNALRIAAQAEETGRQTLERLGAQGEMIHNTERNLDLASNQNRIAAEKARELKTVNGSMFGFHTPNPFNSKRRAQERENKVVSDAQRDREEREATRAAAWGNNARQQEYAREMKGGVQQKSAKNLADRAKYQFEAVSCPSLVPLTQD